MNPVVTVTGFWDAFTTKIAVFLPNLLFAIATILLGWVICNVIKRVVGGLGGLEAIVRATERDLEAVDGVGSVRAREIREGLRRLQEHNLVDRYLNL